MELRYHLDDSGEPHIYGHGVTELEVEEVLDRPLEKTPGRGESVIALGRTRAGRFLKVIYSPADEGPGIFVISAFDLAPKQVRAMNRRLRRKRR